MSVSLILGRFVPALLLIVLAACGPRPGEAPIPEGAVVTHRAVLIGKSNHDTVGTLSLYESDEPAVVVFEAGFRMSPTEETIVALGRDGYRADTVLGPLLRPHGRQCYAVPDDLDIRAYNEVWIWNTRDDHPLGIARLTRIAGEGV